MQGPVHQVHPHFHEQGCQQDAEEAHAGKAEVLQQYKDMEKKVKNLEAEMIQLQEDLSAAERARRTAEAERDDLQEEISSNAGKGSILSGKFYNLDRRILKSKHIPNKIVPP